MKPFDLNTHRHMSAIEDAALFFAGVALGYRQGRESEQAAAYHRAAVEAAVQAVGLPLVLVEQALRPTHNHRGMVYLILRWGEEDLRCMVFPEIAGEAVRWWDEYVKARLG